MSLVKCVTGPRLYAEYRDPQTKIYAPNVMEKYSDYILLVFRISQTLTKYTWPFIGMMIYSKGAFIFDNLPIIAKIFSSFCAIAFISWILRGVGRYQNRDYRNFMEIFEQQACNLDQMEMKKFDYDFKWVNVDFDARELTKPVAKKVWTESVKFNIFYLPHEILAYVAMHTFGIRMLYPGSITLLQLYIQPILIRGRAHLIHESSGERFKLISFDGNTVDTVFVDRRGESPNGDILVICCEGNAGFYESGIMSTPMNLNYSALGWNHPGFSGSTGTPYPRQEQSAVESVLAFAIHKLQFKEEDILLFGWSIGGYSALWAAACYPNVKGVVLDATFDDVANLACTRTPDMVSDVVKIGIRRYCNLNNMELLSGYDGPITIIRRLEDEIIAVDQNLATNRGNILLLVLLGYRYPFIYNNHHLLRVQHLLECPLDEKTLTSNNDKSNADYLALYMNLQGGSFPMRIGENYNDEKRTEVARFLLAKYLRDYQSAHCTALPNELFKLPWGIPDTQEFPLPRS